MKDSPSYYSILPAIVRYDKDLTDFAKVLFSELTALANKTGKAYPNNKTLARWFGKSAKTISTTISLLEAKKYIIVEIDKNPKGTFRSIIPLVDPLSLGGGKKRNTPITETSTPIEENVYPKEYTYNNTTSNNNKKDISIEDKGEEPKKEIPYLQELEQILLLFEELTGRGFRIPSDSKVLRYGAYKKVAAVLRAGYSLEDITSVIKLKYKDWKDSKKYAIYIRYETLMHSVEKFEKYKGELDITEKLGNNNNSSHEKRTATNKEESIQDRLDKILKQSRKEGFI